LPRSLRLDRPVRLKPLVGATGVSAAEVVIELVVREGDLAPRVTLSEPPKARATGLLNHLNTAGVVDSVDDDRGP
jgi:hypothetical protein